MAAQRRQRAEALKGTPPDKGAAALWLRHQHRRWVASGCTLLWLAAVLQQSASRVRRSRSSDSQSASFVDKEEAIVVVRCNEAARMMQCQMIYGERENFTTEIKGGRFVRGSRSMS